MINLFDSAWTFIQEESHGTSHDEPAHDVAEHAADAAHASSGLPQLDMATWPGQLFWLAVTFTVLFIFLWRVILPKIGTAIENRRDRIADDLDAAATLKLQSDESATEYERLLTEARSKAHAMAMDNRAAVESEVAAEAADADEEIAKRQETAEKRISEMRTVALANVRDIAIDTTQAIVSELTGTKADAKAVAAAVDANGTGS
jgi:F-type H+-transporting ATPase subunit b